MHELFLTAQVSGDDLQGSLRVLQGYCGMSPVSLLRRRLIWEGPKSRSLKGIDPAFVKKQGLKQPLWRSLHEQLIRQSYIITLVYDVDRSHFGQLEGGNVGAESSGEAVTKEPITDCDELLGNLRWSDLPDPQGAKPVNSRLIVNIENERGLCTTMKMMGHKFSQEVIQECYRFVRGSVVFDLSRYLQIPQDPENKSLATTGNQLPSYESLIPFDSENKWMLMASVGVLNGNDPELIQRGTEDLMVVKREFEGCFDFQALDRHIFDTRVRF